MWDQIEQSLRLSMDRVITKIAMLLPGLLAFVVAVVIFTAIGWLLALLVRRVLGAVKFDERLRDRTNAIAEWSSSQTPSLVMTRMVYWVCVFAGVIIGLSAFEAASSESGIAGYVFAYLPRIIGAAIVLFVGTMIARFLSRSVLIGAVNSNLQYARLLSAGVKWLVLVLTAAMALDHLAIGGQIVALAFGILFGGIVLALALAVGLGSRELVTRSLERETNKPPETPMEERLHHF
jgi:hypothetical protein